VLFFGKGNACYTPLDELIPAVSYIASWRFGILTEVKIYTVVLGADKYWEVLTFVNQFMVTGAPPTARCVQILLMNQYASWPITFRMK
jgi:hypothetical protein